MHTKSPDVVDVLLELVLAQDDPQGLLTLGGPIVGALLLTIPE
jgi:hypothetical protein